MDQSRRMGPSWASQRKWNSLLKRHEQTFLSFQSVNFLFFRLVKLLLEIKQKSQKLKEKLILIAARKTFYKVISPVNLYLVVKSDTKRHLKIIISYSLHPSILKHFIQIMFYYILLHFYVTVVSQAVYNWLSTMHLQYSVYQESQIYIRDSYAPLVCPYNRPCIDTVCCCCKYHIQILSLLS